MELCLGVSEHDTQAIPEGCMVSVRVGDVQKQSRFAPGKFIKFPETRRYVKVDLLQRVGTCDFRLDADFEGNNPCKIMSDNPMFAGIELQCTARLTGRLPEIKSPERLLPPPAEKPAAQPVTKQYLKTHGIEVLLSGAMKEVLRQQPENVPEFLAKYWVDYCKQKTGVCLDPIPIQEAKTSIGVQTDVDLGVSSAVQTSSRKGSSQEVQTESLEEAVFPPPSYPTPPGSMRDSQRLPRTLPPIQQQQQQQQRELSPDNRDKSESQAADLENLYDVDWASVQQGQNSTHKRIPNTESQVDRVRREKVKSSDEASFGQLPSVGSWLLPPAPASSDVNESWDQFPSVGSWLAPAPPREEPTTSMVKLKAATILVSSALSGNLREAFTMMEAKKVLAQRLKASLGNCLVSSAKSGELREILMTLPRKEKTEERSIGMSPITTKGPAFAALEQRPSLKANAATSLVSSAKSGKLREAFMTLQRKEKANEPIPPQGPAFKALEQKVSEFPSMSKVASLKANLANSMVSCAKSGKLWEALTTLPRKEIPHGPAFAALEQRVTNIKSSKEEPLKGPAFAALEHHALELKEHTTTGKVEPENKLEKLRTKACLQFVAAARSSEIFRALTKTTSKALVTRACIGLTTAAKSGELENALAVAAPPKPVEPSRELKNKVCLRLIRTARSGELQRAFAKNATAPVQQQEAERAFEKAKQSLERGADTGQLGAVLVSEPADARGVEVTVVREEAQQILKDASVSGEGTTSKDTPKILPKIVYYQHGERYYQGMGIASKWLKNKVLNQFIKTAKSNGLNLALANARVDSEDDGTSDALAALVQAQAALFDANSALQSARASIQQRSRSSSPAKK